MSNKKTAISLFASSRIGDLALEHENIKVMLANELIFDRSQLFKHNFPHCEMLNGDI